MVCVGAAGVSCPACELGQRRRGRIQRGVKGV